MLDDQINELSSNAVEIAKQMGVNADYSNESIQSIEKVLDSFADQNKQQKFDESKLTKIADIFGAYIGTTLIKNLGMGKWDIEPVHNAVSVNINGDYIFFPAKVYRKLSDKEAENVSVLYETVYSQYSI
jgi:hypothetical protein